MGQAQEICAKAGCLTASPVLSRSGDLFRANQEIPRTGYVWRDRYGFAGSHSWVWTVPFHKYRSPTATGLKVGASSKACVARQPRGGRSPSETRFREAGFSIVFASWLWCGRFARRQSPNELAGENSVTLHLSAAGRDGEAEIHGLRRTPSRTTTNGNCRRIESHVTGLRLPGHYRRHFDRRDRTKYSECVRVLLIVMAVAFLLLISRLVFDRLEARAKKKKNGGRKN